MITSDSIIKVHRNRRRHSKPNSWLSPDVAGCAAYSEQTLLKETMASENPLDVRNPSKCPLHRNPYQNPALIFFPLYHAPTSKFSSGKNVVTTVRSANFLPASARSAFCAPSGESYLTKILPTPAEDLLGPEGRGILTSRMVPYLEHSS